MITRAECLVKARDCRIAGFKTLSLRDRLVQEREVGTWEYPEWLRNLDKTAGTLFAEAEKYQKLARGSFLGRWLA